MNSINFIKAVSPSEHRSQRRWRAFSWLLIISSLGIMSTISITELLYIRALQEQKNLLINPKQSERLNKQMYLEKEHHLLKVRNDTIRSCAAQRDHLINVMSLVDKILGKTFVESIDLQENRLKVIVTTPTIAQSNTLVAGFEKEDLFYDVKLTNLHRQHADALNYQITIEARIRQLVKT